MKKPKSSQANETASSQVGDSAVPTEKPQTTSPNTAEEQTNSSQTILNRTLNRSCVPALIMCYLSKMLPVLASQLKSLFPENAHWFLVNPPYPKRLTSLVLSKSPLSQALNRIYFPADVSGAQHSATYYVYFEPASSNHNPSPRQQKSNGRPEFNKLNDQLACVKLPLNEEKLKSLSSATQSTPPISLHPQTQSISLL